MKRIIVLIIMFMLSSCSPYKFRFSTLNDTAKSMLDDNLFEAYGTKPNELYLCFMTFYDDYQVTVIENNLIIYDSLISTDNKGIAKAFKINNDSDMTVWFEDFKKPLKIKSKDLKGYKFVFLYKQDGNVFVKFNSI